MRPSGAPSAACEKAMGPAAVVVILSYALIMAGLGIDPGERVKFRLLRPRQACLTFSSVRLAAPVRPRVVSPSGSPRCLN